MRVTITTGGSRGDVQPYVALGVGLRRAGAEVCLATAPDFEDFVRSEGLDFYPVSLDVQKLISDMIDEGGSTVGLARGLAERFGPMMDQNLADYWAASEKSDSIIWGPSGFLGGHIARARGIPSAAAEMQPILRPTGSYRSSVIPPIPASVDRGRLGRVVNRLSYVVVHELFWQFFRRSINKTITEGLGLEPMVALEEGRRATGNREPVLCAWSPHVLARPPDYGNRMHVTGYWFLKSEDWTPPSELKDFLAVGPAPVSIGFGSMNRLDPGEMVEAVTGALRRTRRRGILLTGWSEITQADVPDDLLVLEGAPHDWLFPKVAAAVHHGGSGTTAASLRAGVPTVTTPVFFDQRFWGERVHALGAGPAPLLQGRLHGRVTGERLAHAIDTATTSETIRRSAREIGERLRAEDGVGNATKVLRAEGVV